MRHWQRVHPLIRSAGASRRAYGKEIDRTRASEIEEIGGNGVTGEGGMEKLVAAGNDKLMQSGLESLRLRATVQERWCILPN